MCAFGNYLLENPVIITGVLVIIGWAVVHFSSKHRDFKNKQREIRIQYLINAWRKVAEADTIGNDKSLTDALFDIQLLGTPEEIQQIKQVIKARFKDEYAGRELIHDLRNRLRKELDLAPTDEIVLGFKVGK